MMNGDLIRHLDNATVVTYQTMSGGGGGGSIHTVATTEALEDVIGRFSAQNGAPTDASATAASWHIKHRLDNGWGVNTRIVAAVPDRSSPTFAHDKIPADARCLVTLTVLSSPPDSSVDGQHEPSAQRQSRLRRLFGGRRRRA